MDLCPLLIRLRSVCLSVNGDLSHLNSYSYDLARTPVHVVVLAGFAAPGVFISKYGSYSEGVATADSDYLFAISDYKVCNVGYGMYLRDMRVSVLVYAGYCN